MLLLTKILRSTYTQFLEDESAQHAAALAFNMLLALVPLVTVCLTVLTAFPSFAGLKGTITQFIGSHLVTDFATTIENHFEKFITQTRHLSIVGSLLLLATAILMIFNLEKSFNRIWHVKKGRSGVTGILLYWGVLTLLPLLLGSGIVMTSFVMRFISKGHFLPNIIIHYTLLLVPYFLTLTGFSLLYLALPNRNVPIKCAFAGGFVATILFEIAKYSFTLYIYYFPTYQLIYGAIAIIPLFLIWLYLVLAITLIGATISRVLYIHQFSNPHMNSGDSKDKIYDSS